MSFSIFPTRKFERELKRLTKKFPSLKSEYASLLDSLGANPKIGTSIGNNCYKIRLTIASKGKGKRGGGRVISYLYLQKEAIYLLTIYDKSEKTGISEGELVEMVKGLAL